MKKALITGITGQDGSYLAELLLEKGYEVHGLMRRSSTEPLLRIQHLVTDGKITLHLGDLRDSEAVSYTHLYVFCEYETLLRSQ